MTAETLKVRAGQLGTVEEQYAGFLVEAGWVSSTRTASLRARDETAQAVGAGLRMLSRVARWDAEHRGVRFFDVD